MTSQDLRIFASLGTLSDHDLPRFRSHVKSTGQSQITVIQIIFVKA